ncbi:DEAH-box RNA helicase-like protein [Westerdykella ornata]|uniref:RNA helicase n=1 Tax=Westerdykella ornata TaxID=318751 RepID=A0A6A6JCQ7_WESOR|nr:DEAH-box RNA helicase-like protein [Westerdykella ornata]KAF2274212.1 DEAH-box RNA helicase-like protein [Westerdykella ornata]
MPKFVPRQRKHKVLARQKSTRGPETPTANDTNTAAILPADQRDRAERKKELREELAREAQGKMSAKKKKRLEKYIDKKLKKEENLELLKKLAAQKVDTSLFASSKRLGAGGEETRRERLRRAQRERLAGVDVERNEGLLFERRRVRGAELDVDGESGEEEEEEEEVQNVPVGKVEKTSQAPSVKTPDSISPPAEPAKPNIQGLGERGSGLKRPLELDESGRPIIQARKRQKKAKTTPVVDEVEWEGFSSEEEQPSSGTEESEEDSEDEDGSEDDGSGSENQEESSEEEGSEADEDKGIDAKVKRKERASAFKAWATQQRNDVVGFTPTVNIEYTLPPKPANFQPRAPEAEPLPPELETNTATDATRKAFSVAVKRSPEIEKTRLQLPIVAEEQKVMEAIHNHDIVIVWGATGSGKTTQVPQFLYEAGYGAPDGPTPGMIGVTQPRRVAAVSMSKRVSDELGDAGSKVAHQIRFDKTVTPDTTIKFMTDGVLLREASEDVALSKYSALIIDEAHERSVNTDVLIGMLSKTVKLRRDENLQNSLKVKYTPLKVVIMSATLRISDFIDNKRLFPGGPPPLVKVEGRQYNVTTHFAKRTERDYVEAAYRKVCIGHRKLPPGGMLVFLTGQNEITQLEKKLKQAFPATERGTVKHGKVLVSAAETALENEDIELGGDTDDEGWNSEEDHIWGLDEEEEEEEKEFDIGEAPEATTMKVHVLPLYSQLREKEQLKVFEPPPEGSRLIVLATNVAETSLTIPGIRYVFDCGRAKERKYDLTTGVQKFEVDWISKASADQRKGRAGRTGHGHCWRLYSSAVFERYFEEYPPPEILKAPLEGVVLQLTSLGIPVDQFPFPTSPDRDSLKRAEKVLWYLGALSPDRKRPGGTAITKVGRELSLYPLHPRFSRMLVMGVRHSWAAAETVALVAALSVPELMVPENKLNLQEPRQGSPDGIRTDAENLEAEQRSKHRKAYNEAQSKLAENAKRRDVIKLYNAVCTYAHASNPKTFCETMFLNSKAMHEASKLREQLTHIVRARHPTAISSYEAKLPPPSDRLVSFFSQVCAAGFIDQVALRADLSANPPELRPRPKSAINVPYVTLFPSSQFRSHAKMADPSSQYVYLHPSSILARTPVDKLPAYIIYSHLQQAAPSTVTISGAPVQSVPKTRVHPLTPITTPELIHVALGTPLLKASKPKGLPKESGKGQRVCVVELSLVGEGGRQGWGLGDWNVRQKERNPGEWVVEEILEAVRSAVSRK